MAEDLQKRFTINVDTAIEKATPSIFFFQGDTKTAILIINITENNNAIDLTGRTVRANFRKIDATNVFQDATTGLTIKDALNGQIEIVLTSQVLAIAGKVRGQLAVNDANGGLVAESVEFTFSVKESLANNAVASSNDLPIVEEMIEAADILNDIDLQTIVDNTTNVNNLKTEVETARNGKANLSIRIGDILTHSEGNSTKIGTITTFRPEDPDLITKMKNEFKEREFNLRWYIDYATKDGSGNVTDWGPAFRQIISEATSTTNVSYGLGISIVVGYGIYQVLTSINNINKSNISIRGMGFGATSIKSLIDDGSALFDVECLVAGHLNYFSMKDLTISGENKNAIGIRMKKTSICTFDKVRIRNFASHGMYLEEVYDSYWYGVSFTGCGKMSVDNNITTSKHAVYVYNGTADNSNRLIFTACHFEANYGSHFYSNSTGNSRKNAQIKFIGTKFHGLDPNNLANCPATPHMYLDAELVYVESCMFYQCNHDFILVKGDRNKFIANDFHNNTGAWINLTDTSTGNATIGCAGGAYGSGRQKYEDNSTGDNFISSHMTTRKFAWNNLSVGDDGGRLALWFNMFRNNSKYQLDGSLPSYATNLGVDGINMHGIAASGSSGSVIAPYTLLSVDMARVRSYKPLQLTAVAIDATIPNNSFFVDAADNVLKFKNNSGVIKIVNLT